MDLVLRGGKVIDGTGAPARAADVGIEGIVAARPVCPSIEAMRAWLAVLVQGLARDDRAVIDNVLRDAVPDYRGEAA